MVPVIVVAFLGQLARKAWAATRTSLRRSPLKRSRPKPAVATQAMRDALAVRSDGWCEARLPGICVGRAVHRCHRVTKGKGGRPLGDDQRLSNFWHGCYACHQWTHHEVTKAKALGLMLENHEDPPAVRIFYRGERWALLDDDGGVKWL